MIDNSDLKFKVEFLKYEHQVNIGFNICYEDYGKGWREFYIIFHLWKCYIVIGFIH